MINAYLHRTTSAAPLALFRAAFGLLIFAGVVRFWSKGWIEDLYITPKVFFPFYGFEFVQPLGQYTYLLFAICGLSALAVAIGWYYRVAAVSLFLSFTYIELIDKSTYLNHYYFISIISLVMIFLPAHVRFSIDARRNPSLHHQDIPLWTIHSLKFFVGMLYFFAGLAKVNSDWLLHALPLKIWLPAKNDLWLIGSLMDELWVAYAFSWIGCLYDLSIPFLLLNRFARPYAYVAVIVFHVLTSMLFPIGMFPYIMIVTALIFFSPTFHERVLNSLQRLFGLNQFVPVSCYAMKSSIRNMVVASLSLLLLIQLMLPFRYMLYPGELFWTEEGYRFSWRVMLMEKAGLAEFEIRDDTGKRIIADNSIFLTRLQEKMMATQPDMILQYAHILRDHYASQGFVNPKVYVNSYVTLNGRRGQPLIDPSTNLAEQKEGWHHKPWILNFNEDIKGI